MFELSGVSRIYTGSGPAVAALRPVDLDIGAGSYTAIMGPSGSGKSTLLNLLGLLDRPSGGRLRIDSVETTTLNPTEVSVLRARTIGFVFQAFHLLAGRTVLDNVTLALVYRGVPPRQRRDLASETLDRVGLSHRLGHNARTLSGGEQQRVAIARALVGGAKVLLCDEPTGNLDRATGAAILDLLRELHGRGLTIIAVTHDAAVAAEADRVIHLRDGAIHEEAAK